MVTTYLDPRGRVIVDGNIPVSGCAYRSFFVAAGFPAPNLVFESVLLDKKHREDVGVGLPDLTERHVNGKQQHVGGAYAWIHNPKDGCFPTDRPLEVIYAGKAGRVRNRLQQEWSGIDRLWWDDFPDNPIQMICVWLGAAERASMEARLINHFRPRYNRRAE